MFYKLGLSNVIVNKMKKYFDACERRISTHLINTGHLRLRPVSDPGVGASNPGERAPTYYSANLS